MDDRGATSTYYDRYDETSDGWMFFAGCVLGLIGIMRIIDSIWAFGYNGSLPEGLQDGVLGENLNNYAWLWLVVGIVLLLSSFAVLARSQLARWIGIAATVIAAISAMPWMPYYPVWTLIYILMALAAFYGLAMYGGRDG